MANKVIPFTRLADFKTQFNSHQRVQKVVGTSEHVLYSSRVADDGTVELIPSGTEDIYAMIQSHKDSCDIHVLLARYKNGDETALARVQGVYGDFVNMPTTYAELLNSVIRGENLFNSLPVEVRAKFDHSLEKFIVAMDDMPSFLEKVGVKSEVPAENSGSSATDNPASPAEPAVSA